jgi:putative hemolysin
MVNEGHEQGAIDEDEAEMISNIFELDDKQAHDIMTHRGDIDALDSTVVLDDAVRYMVNAPNSRFPVFEGTIDNITGALYLKDAMLFYLKEQYHSQAIGQIPHLLREVKFIPETVDVDELFRQMQESRKQMAIVVNEYGETSGLVTMEDILEEIVGNILDEYDNEEKLIAKTGDGHLRMNGKALLEDVGKALGKTIDQEDYDTLSGYLTEKLGHIPTLEDRGRVIEDRSLGYLFRILSISGTMIGWLDVTRAQDP